MTNKKLGLLLLPFVPLTAIGIVEVAGMILPADDVAIVEAPICKLPPKTLPRVVEEPRYSKPHFAPAPAPAPHPVGVG